MFFAGRRCTLFLAMLVVLAAAAPPAKTPTETPKGEIVIIPLTRQRKPTASAATVGLRRDDPPPEPAFQESDPPATLYPPPSVDVLLDLHGEVTVGDQSFSVIFDTMGADIRLLGPECPDWESYGKVVYKPRGDPDLAPIYRDPENESAPSLGKVFEDTVTVGRLKVEAQAFATVDEIDEELMKSNADGYVGMGPPKMAFNEKSSLLQSLLHNGQLDKAIFAFLLRQKEDCYSEMSLGGVNPKIATEDIEYIPVAHKALWVLTVRFSVSGRVVGRKQRAWIDTSSDNIVGDADAVRRIYRRIPGSELAGDNFPPGVYTVPCITKNLPPISLTFGQSTRAFVLNVDSFVRKTPHDGCYGGIIAASEPMEEWVIGSPFLYDVYTVFDVTEGKARIGFGAVPDEMRCAALTSS